MITTRIIKSLYRAYPKRNESEKNLNLPILAMKLSYINTQNNDRYASITTSHIIFNTISEDSPIHSIPIKNICRVKYSSNQIAIITRQSIIFINSNNGDINVHIAQPQLSIIDILANYINLFADKFNISGKNNDTIHKHKKTPASHF